MADFSIKESVATPKVKIASNSRKERLNALAALVKGVQASAGRIESYLPTLLNKAMEANAWSWPRETQRQNGTTAGRVRDIVDTGTLKGSLKISTKFLKTRTTFTISYSAPYAELVHEGGYIAPYGRSDVDSVFLPGRPWITAALSGATSGVEGIDLQREFLSGVPSRW